MIFRPYEVVSFFVCSHSQVHSCRVIRMFGVEIFADRLFAKYSLAIVAFRRAMSFVAQLIAVGT